MSEFKGMQRAEEYVNNAFFDSGENKNIDKCFKNFAKGGFLDGYNQALEDSKAKEMLEMLKSIVEYGGVANYDKIKELIKQATEL